MLPADDGGSTTRSTRLRRYGPLAVIVVLLLAVGAVVLVGGGDDEDDPQGEASPGEIDWKSPGSAEPGAPGPTGLMPVTYAEADGAGGAGGAGDLEWPDTCDTERGRVMLPSVYALPCVPAFDGDNGGVTAQGVTEDSIKVVYYWAEQGADLASLLGAMGANDTAEEQQETIEQYVDIYTSVTQSYGRKVELVRFAATGLPTDVLAARADATDILAMEPFAVLGGPALDRGAFAQELADAGVLCFACTGSALPSRWPWRWRPTCGARCRPPTRSSICSTPGSAPSAPSAPAGTTPPRRRAATRRTRPARSASSTSSRTRRCSRGSARSAATWPTWR